MQLLAQEWGTRSAHRHRMAGCVGSARAASTPVERAVAKALQADSAPQYVPRLHMHPLGSCGHTAPGRCQCRPSISACHHRPAVVASVGNARCGAPVSLLTTLQCAIGGRVPAACAPLQVCKRCPLAFDHPSMLASIGLRAALLSCFPRLDRVQDPAAQCGLQHTAAIDE